MLLYIRPEDLAAAIKHAVATDCLIYSVNDPRVELVPVQVLEPEDSPITTKDGAAVDLRKPWALQG